MMHEANPRKKSHGKTGRPHGKQPAGKARRGRDNRPHLRMKPEAEPSLKPVFAKIGKPAAATFRPDPFQLDALEAIRKEDCLVMAPTGSGKTWIAEEAIRSVFQNGGRCWYASPLKALTNAKWVEFGNHFESANVGIVTGDTKENTDAPILVGTTEILRNQLYDAMHSGRNLNCDLVILDEAHFLGDRDRGVVWEEIMIYLPVRINLLLLSATIGNGEEIAAWLASIRGKPCRVIVEENRPVPLFPLFLHPSGRLMPLVEKSRLFGKIDDFIGRRQHGRSDRGLPPFGEMMEVLDHFNLLPAIFFLKSRTDCDAALGMCGTPADSAADEAFLPDLETLLERFPYLRNHRQLHDLRTARVAAHHGGQLPAWKFLVETMMKQGRLKAIFATSTVAAGVNFPARTIVLMNSDLFNGHDFSPLSGTEFHQMTGRAGRRGQDRVGFMLTVPGRFMDLIHVRKLLSRKPEAIASRIRNDFSMVLNLLLSQTPEDIREIFAKSLAAYQRSHGGMQGRAEEQTDLWNDFQRHLRLLREEGFVGMDNRLTENGAWASKLRLDQPLLIAECLRRGVFPRGDEKLLAAVIAPFVYDGDQDLTVIRKELPGRLTRACDRVVKTLSPLAGRLKEGGFPVAPLFLWPAVVIYEWAAGGDWDRIIRKAGITDGDMAMLIMRTADNLRQVMSLRETHPEMAALATAARGAILREPVVF
ncbi:MAG: DEAD/DEAH box helicase [Syntrophaceae bacterium]|nr:DEAD/DEAH box helicase [Syntrophaceae bacterium]